MCTTSTSASDRPSEPLSYHECWRCGRPPDIITGPSGYAWSDGVASIFNALMQGSFWLDQSFNNVLGIRTFTPAIS
jgi:hypothetical protein